MSNATHGPPTVGVAQLLREGTRFFIPHHQRDYSWTEDEIEQFLEDVQEARATGQSEYFIGLMVFMANPDGGLKILDGQQRLATTSIVLAAIRSWLTANGDSRNADLLQTSYIAVRELGEDEIHPRLVLNQNNNPAYERFVVHEKPEETVEKYLKSLDRYHPDRQLMQATLTSRRFLRKLASQLGEKAPQEFFDLTNYLRDSVKVVSLTVANEANAYTVFETLNDRGLDLTVLDLVKNYLFGRAGNGEERLRDVQKRWTQMMANLTNVRADDFLKAWWTSRHGRVQSAQLFPRFKASVNTWSKVSKSSEDMLSASEQYAALEIADDPVWGDLSEEARDHLRAFKLLGGKQLHPVILSAVDRFSAREQERLLRLMEVLLVRYQLIGGGRTGRLEIACASLAKQIWERQIKTATEAKVALRDLFPSDDEFRASFITKQEKNNRKATFLLKKLEGQARLQQKSGVSARELEPSGSLTLEHILPKKPGEGWDAQLDEDPEFGEEYTYRIGNLTLLSKVNRRLGNQSFTKKRATFDKSELLITRQLAEKDQWDRQAVEHRQAFLARLAVAVWRFD